LLCSAADPSKWTKQQVKSYFTAIELAPSALVLEKEDIDGYALMQLTEIDLRNIGMNIMGPRKLVMKHIIMLLKKCLDADESNRRPNRQPLREIGANPLLKLELFQQQQQLALFGGADRLVPAERLFSTNEDFEGGDTIVDSQAEEIVQRVDIDKLAEEENIHSNPTQ